MHRTFLAGSVVLGLSVFLLLGAFGAGSDTAGIALIELGVPEHFSNNGSRMVSGALLATGIVLQVLGWPSEGSGRCVSHEEFLATKQFAEQNEKI